MPFWYDIMEQRGDFMALDGLLLHQVQKELQSFLPAKLTKLQQISDTEMLFTIRTPIYHDGDTGEFSHAAAKAD